MRQMIMQVRLCVLAMAAVVLVHPPRCVSQQARTTSPLGHHPRRPTAPTSRIRDEVLRAQEDGLLSSSSPAEHFLMDSMAGSAGGGPGGVSGPPQMMDEPQALSGDPGSQGLGPNAVNLSQFRSPSTGPGGHVPLQQMRPSPHQALGPQGQHMQQQLRREGSAAVSAGARDTSMHLRQLWPDNPQMDPGMMSMGPMGGMPGAHGPGPASMMAGGELTLFRVFLVPQHLSCTRSQRIGHCFFTQAVVCAPGLFVAQP
jgi:hypothetical protein